MVGEEIGGIDCMFVCFSLVEEGVRVELIWEQVKALH